MDTFEYSSVAHFNNNNFNMFQPDFTPQTEFENLLSAVRYETMNPIEKFCLDYECHHFTNSCMAMQLSPQLYGHNETIDGIGIGIDIGIDIGSSISSGTRSGPGNGIDFDIDSGSGTGSGIGNGNDNDNHSDIIGGNNLMDPSLNLMWNQDMDDVKVSRDDNSSETVTTCNPDTQKRSGGGVKGDRSKTLISERKRRSGMKEKLYALRALVPYITKMDKASIVGDAARYIQDLQTQARILRSEIAALEATKSKRMSSQTFNKKNVSNYLPVSKKISKMDMFNVEEKGYYVRLVCNKGRGVAVALHRALESITSFEVQSSNLATVGDNFVLTFTLNVTACEFDINLPNLKLWLSGAFLTQGFEFSTIPSP